MRYILFLFLLFNVLFSLDAPPEDYINVHEILPEHEYLEKSFLNASQTVEKSLNISECSASQEAHEFRSTAIKNSFIALFISILFISLIYMAGSFFQLPNLMALAKDELNNVATTALFVMLISGFFVSVSLSNYVFGVDIYKEASLYTYKIMYQTSKYLTWYTLANNFFNLVYTVYLPLGSIRRSVGIGLGPMLKPLIDISSYTLRFLIVAYGSWVIFGYTFCFISQWFLPFFLPLGIFLRSFAPTRGAGNVLIALALSLSLIYPFMFYINSLIYNMQFSYFEQRSALPLFKETLLYGFSIFFGLGILGAVSSKDPQSPSYGKFLEKIKAFSSIAALIFFSGTIIVTFGTLAIFFYELFEEVAYLIVVFSLILPVLNIFITLTFTREIALLLGTEVSISGLVKVI